LFSSLAFNVVPAGKKTLVWASITADNKIVQSTINTFFIETSSSSLPSEI
jgi:hypothetical protein